MSAPDWQQVSALFEQAVVRPAAARVDWIREASPDEATAAEVLSLLRAYEADPGFLDAPVNAEAVVGTSPAAGSLPGARHIGPYAIVREIGRGGMGVVFEARDGRFDRRVALKLLPAPWAAPVLAERFELERRVLASLGHPNIARFLDGGTTEDGLPYFVMEYVEGERVDVWCDREAPAVRDRVRLLVTLCDAVTHAHQHLVVHRDIKPANILITADGQPKLLDFGIATLVSAESGASAGATQTGQASFTPEYASPEQVRGGPVTTATDVYSLGVLAYRLLAGRPPYDLRHHGSALDMIRVICEQEPRPPSAVAGADAGRALRGDLDTIVMKALRKEPDHRYPSVAALGDDLTAWLEGRVVAAAPATLPYRLRKFAARHRLALLAAAAVAVAVAGGIVATVWQARVAQQERDRAERRFNEVRTFSRSLLFEVHEALRTLPGATEPRRLLLARAVQFLDGLAADADNDDSLKLELAEGYRRLGQVQGSAVSENLGDVAGAVVSFEKAARLAEDVFARRPEWVAAASAVSGAYDDLSMALVDQNRLDEAEQAHARHRAVVEAIEQRFGSNPATRASLAGSYLDLGRYRSTRRDLAGARLLYERALALIAGLPADHRSTDEVIRTHAFTLKRLGAIHLVEGRIDEGERLYTEALALDDAMVTRHPEDARYRYDMTFTMSDLGYAARQRGDTSRAIALWTRALGIREAAVAADPKDVRALGGLANLHVNLGNALRGLGRYEDAISHWRAVVRTRLAIAVQSGQQPGDMLKHAEANSILAGCLLDRAGTVTGEARQALVTEARALLAAAAAAATPHATEADARAILGQIRIERERLARF